jgi:hypothetical protein
MASKRGVMNRYAKLDLRNSDVVRARRNDARMTIIRRLMMVAIVGVVVLAIVVESRLSPEQRLELFEATYVYP